LWHKNGNTTNKVFFWPLNHRFGLFHGLLFALFVFLLKFSSGNPALRLPKTDSVRCYLFIMHADGNWQAVEGVLSTKSAECSGLHFHLSPLTPLSRLFILHAWPMPSRLRRSERRRHENICGKFLHNALASTSNCTHTVTAQQLSFECLNDRRDRSCSLYTRQKVECWRDRPKRSSRRWRDRPLLDRTHLVFDEVVPMVRQEATRPDSDLHPHWRVSLLQSLCRALGQTEASSNF